MDDKIAESMESFIRESKSLGLSDADMTERVLNRYQRDIFMDALVQYKNENTIKKGEQFLLFFWTFTNDLPFGIGTISRAINESTSLASAEEKTVFEKLNEKYSNRGYKYDDPLKNDLLRGLGVKNSPLVVLKKSQEEKILKWINEKVADRKASCRERV